MVTSFDIDYDSGDPWANVQPWINAYELTHPVGYDENGTLWAEYGAGYIPHSVVIGQLGTVLYSDSHTTLTGVINAIETELDNAPVKPTGLVVTAETPNSIDLAWNHNIEKDVIGYRLTYNQVIKGTKAVVDVGYVNTYSVGSLPINTLYEFILEAYDYRDAQPNVPSDPIYGMTQGDCSANPVVDVTPDGPFEYCVGTNVLLAVNTTGGTGPFTFQWMEDWINIPGATDSTYIASSSGTHIYNCDVTGFGCSNSRHDTPGVTINWQVEPDFNGLVSVVDQYADPCALELTWDAASSVCPGPFSYTIYRDTTSPVSIIPANELISGVTTTTFIDSNDLSYGTTYYYVVQATDHGSTGQDNNTIESLGSPNGPGGGYITLYNYDFESTPEWNNWTVTTGPGSHTCGPWARATTSSQRPPDSSGYYALTDSDACGSGSWTSTILTSPYINGDVANLTWVTLDCDIYYRYYNGGDSATIEVFDGSFWHTIWSDPNASTETHISLDVSSYAVGNPNFRVRFNYQNANYDYWFAVDNLVIEGFTEVSCSNGIGCSLVIDTLPDGTSLACTGDNIVFTANLTGGSGPFSYQWTEDGVDLAGETNDILTINYAATQTHIYNCKVSDSSGYCLHLIDPVSSRGTWEVCSSPPPPPAADGNTGSPMELTKLSGDTIQVDFDIVSCVDDHAVILYGDITDFTSYVGPVDVGCNIGDSGNSTFDISAGNVWFNLIWVNSSGDAGHPGFSSSGDRAMIASGFCSVTGDDHSDTVCD